MRPDKQLIVIAALFKFFSLLRMKAQILILSLAAALVYTATPYTDCGSTADISGFDVDGCTNPPCRFVRGQNSTVRINMTSSFAADDLHGELIIVDPETNIIIQLLHDDACDDLLVGDCPVAAGEYISYKRTIYVSPSWRNLSIDATFNVHEINAVTGEEGESLGCFTVPVIIV